VTREYRLRRRRRKGPRKCQARRLWRETRKGKRGRGMVGRASTGEEEEERGGGEQRGMCRRCHGMNGPKTLLTFFHQVCI